MGIEENDLILSELRPDDSKLLCAARDQDNKEAEIARLRAIREKTFKDVCPTIYQNSDFTLLGASARNVYEFPYSRQGLIVKGQSGRGKTRAMWALVKSLYVDHGFAFEWMDALTFSDNSIAAARDNTLAAYVKRLTVPAVLVLDDLGKSKMTQKVGEALFSLVEARTSREKPIYITTNFIGDTLSARFEDEETSQPLLRRLREFCHTITL